MNIILLQILLYFDIWFSFWLLCLQKEYVYKLLKLIGMAINIDRNKIQNIQIIYEKNNN